jgi:putative membrane protein
MEQFCFWNNGMWIFPMIGCCVMMFFCIAMMFFCRRGFGRSNFGHPFYRQRNCSKFPKDDNYSETAIEVLNRRYANGDISKEEYERIKKDILS